MIVKVNKLDFYYGKFQALIDVNLEAKKNEITALIGPSGCGKSTFLRCLNRMNDLIEGTRTTGEIFVEGENILDPNTDLVKLRKKVGMVFQRPNPFPLSVFENIAFGPRVHHLAKGKELEEIVRQSLEAVLLWDKLKDQLSRNALTLSLEAQQRLCIARLIAVKPDILLMDEPCSALDPVSTQRVEELMQILKQDYSILIVTHNMQQAARVSGFTGFFLLGKLIEFDITGRIFTAPRDRRTEDYITGRYG
ncbi:phosphate ABC transporter ATP-binding protein [candidate division WOR-1 bacterium RIFOXYA12_FULL_43_27]|uniref:Phosphate ABC transporter ATP-binding protein n=1 Tax=candidate division WOR-1 bacterium RIFOXYC2_FULL_46_14 TaxID=1802587 RepID=A0A1F4U4V8_UNCSA|nr:MAG: phosphate ABC transporter ATP-binding protein [candidate division WOR-1 bacterium RIFOXYA12_FULL_43_27]OGC20674.1 MAG: phosphate ABC transporter ATP-binding protein [candidate division WOR-1 bacterium RIFOXYB2_FULL_46_45]OGC31589.1 MAG: phosphate ABC transporter ATP-binding protein [candidate division WOR-1 bacterium RIFOXYA2_FULL_46_56]OGC39994.1 MAG: phosphate ABC transporter ATP-binding protein [candidate division WOR-1 bacterium RIFOXYC2_FULL_46_14]